MFVYMNVTVFTHDCIVSSSKCKSLKIPISVPLISWNYEIFSILKHNYALLYLRRRLTLKFFTVTLWFLWLFPSFSHITTTNSGVCKLSIIDVIEVIILRQCAWNCLLPFSSSVGISLNDLKYALLSGNAVKYLKYKNALEIVLFYDKITWNLR